MQKHGFHTFVLPLGKDLFHKLVTSVEFEAVGKGRQGNHLVLVGEAGIPIVRTTTRYNIPAQTFSDIHQQIATYIEQAQGVASHFNNALIELYDRQYAKMGYHSDQCLDIAENSYIALFSCYEHPDDIAPDLLRRLKVKGKATEDEFEIILENNSVVLFSLPTNAAFQHKIVLEIPKGIKPSVQDNRWIGITFRQSKTFIHFKENTPYFTDNTLLQLANEAQIKEFYQLRARENDQVGFQYPPLAYTLSIGDMLVPMQGFLK
jgi:hypothetical protein